MIWGTGKSLVNGESARPPVKNEADMSSVEIFDAIWEQNELARRPLEMNRRAGRLKAGECLYVRREVAAQ